MLFHIFLISISCQCSFRFFACGNREIHWIFISKINSLIFQCPFFLKSSDLCWLYSPTNLKCITYIDTFIRHKIGQSNRNEKEAIWSVCIWSIIWSDGEGFLCLWHLSWICGKEDVRWIFITNSTVYCKTPLLRASRSPHGSHFQTLGSASDSDPNNNDYCCFITHSVVPNLSWNRKVFLH